MAEGDFALALVAEPYTIPEDHPHWFSNRRETVAITWRMANEAMPCTPYSRGEHYVSVRWGDMLVAGTYLSPSMNATQFEDAMEELERWAIQNMDKPIIIAGDLNAKSDMWNSEVTNARGNIVAEWASSLGMCCLNKGRESTCIRLNGESIVDISFANPAAATRVTDWFVFGRESKSDHRYVEIHLQSTRTQIHKRSLPRAKRWATKKLEKDRFLAAIMIRTWPKKEVGAIENLDEQAKFYQKALTEACDIAMPRTKPRPRRAIPWWSEELDRLRQELTNARRQIKRLRRRRVSPENEEIQQKIDGYRQARDNFGKAVRRAKAKAWEEFTLSLNDEPWGRP
ncbi:PREDICTED: uncharacterized protein LOC108769974 [Trachymyrmex cornetzi]|uniref:uncharacterized protein LOC108769974 n=1 Tax=Trachymyrmex cornetzi TaxID=471704 RepID=UPI00084F569A|nr:PREDICTED: uncharacterized protein LOC108769974 [Trachymyrmex cornetzi]